jgi:hypothetical protein
MTHSTFRAERRPSNFFAISSGATPLRRHDPRQIERLRQIVVRSIDLRGALRRYSRRRS